MTERRKINKYVSYDRRKLSIFKTSNPNSCSMDNPNTLIDTITDIASSNDYSLDSSMNSSSNSPDFGGGDSGGGGGTSSDW